jgi:hypothetical protein
MEITYTYDNFYVTKNKYTMYKVQDSYNTELPVTYESGHFTYTWNAPAWMHHLGPRTKFYPTTFYWAVIYMS